jgi:ankyrin repeat protein
MTLRALAHDASSQRSDLALLSSLAVLALLAVLASFGAFGPITAARATEAPLIEAARAGEDAAAAALIADGADVGARSNDGATALHYAAERNDLELADRLLAAGADAAARTRNGVTPLALAATNGGTDMIERLLDHGADPNGLSSEGETPLMLAALNGRPDAVRLLLDHGADPNLIEPFKGQTALMWAAGGGNAEAVTLLVERGARIEPKSHGGFTPLLFAVRNAEAQALEALIKAGASVNAVVPDGTSALNVAVVNGYFEIASILLDAGADPNLPDPRGSPLHTIAWIRKPGATGNAAVGAEADAPIRPTGRVTSLELAKRLLDAGEDPDTRIDWMESRFNKLGGTARNPPGLVLGRHLLTYNGATPFYIASKNGDVELMRVLAEGGADPTLTNRFGITPLMVAAGLDTWEGETPGPHTGVSEAERLEAVRLTIALGNDVNARADFGDYPMEGTTEYTLLYYPYNLDELADLGMGDPRWDDCTALHGSIISSQPSITQYLIDHGADPNAKNALGWTPLMMSRGVFLANAEREFPEAEAILLEALAREE